MNIGSLCSGYGGLDMGVQLVYPGARIAWHVENDAAPSKILEIRYPGVPNYGDLKALDYALMEPVDILTAGYPCQPFSDAGLRKGADDPRHLWPYVADTIGQLRPRLVVLENVRGHVRRGLDIVIADLAALGYDARWGLVRASDAGAPHRRERIFVVAQDADRAAWGERRLAAPGQAQGRWARVDIGGRSGAPAANAAGHRRDEGWPESAGLVGGLDAAEPGREAVPDTGSLGRLWRPDLEGARRDQAERREACGDPGDGDSPRPDWANYDPAIRRWEHVTRRAPWATEPRGRGGAERLSPAFVEWMMGLPAGWVTAVPGLNANEQLKALGNGVVPQQAALALSVLLAMPTTQEVAA